MNVDAINVAHLTVLYQFGFQVHHWFSTLPLPVIAIA